MNLLYDEKLWLMHAAKKELERNPENKNVYKKDAQKTIKKLRESLEQDLKNKSKYDYNTDMEIITKFSHEFREYHINFVKVTETYLKSIKDLMYITREEAENPKE